MRVGDGMWFDLTLRLAGKVGKVSSIAKVKEILH